jgi:photosystem I subunit X
MFTALLTHSLLSSDLLAVMPRGGWSPTVGILMILSNVVAIALAKFTMDPKKSGPALPSGEFFGGFGLGGLLGITSFGHVLGAGVILGLSNMGVI